MINFQGPKFGIILLLFEVAIILIYIFVLEYDVDLNSVTYQKNTSKIRETRYFYSQDVSGMLFVGFGFLMVFLSKYGFSSISINFLLSAIAIQWAFVMNGTKHLKAGKIQINVNELLNAEFSAAAVLISMGAVLGKLSPLQYVLMIICELPVQAWNEFLGREFLHAKDAGDSIFVHEFGAYYGLGVAWIITLSDARHHENEGSRYNSDIFAMIGTVFLWIFWPSFNAGGIDDDDAQQRAIINTVLSLTASVLTTFIINSFVDYDENDEVRGKFNMVYIQNATLAGGVGAGAVADMMIHPWGAIVVGSSAGIISVLGYRFLTPNLNKIYLHDTCGVHNLHGLPGIMSGFGSAVCAVLATEANYGKYLLTVFPHRNTRSGQSQAAYQLAAIGCTFVIALGSGVIVGILLRFIKVCDKVKDNDLFDDHKFFEVPEKRATNPYITDLNDNNIHLSVISNKNTNM